MRINRITVGRDDARRRVAAEQRAAHFSHLPPAGEHRAWDRTRDLLLDEAARVSHSLRDELATVLDGGLAEHRVLRAERTARPRVRHLWAAAYWLWQGGRDVRCVEEARTHLAAALGVEVHGVPR